MSLSLKNDSLGTRVQFPAGEIFVFLLTVKFSRPYDAAPPHRRNRRYQHFFFAQ